jgi:hypothetical protein
VAMLILSMAVMPAMSVESKETTDPQMPDELKQWLEETAVDEETKLWRQEQTEKWMQEHTINLTLTKTYRYEQDELVVIETYSGKELEEKYGMDKVTDTKRYSMDAKSRESVTIEGEIFSLIEGNEKVTVTETTEVVTIPIDAFNWWDYGYEYPRWTWDPSGPVVIKKDPINLAWECATMNYVKQEVPPYDILHLDGWLDSENLILAEEQWVTEPTGTSTYHWVSADNMAEGPFRAAEPAYHTRLFNLTYRGDIVGAAHHEHREGWTHVVDGLECAEDNFASFYDGDTSHWWVLHDQNELDNYVGDEPYTDEPCNDGEATCIWKVSGW